MVNGHYYSSSEFSADYAMTEAAWFLGGYYFYSISRVLLTIIFREVANTGDDHFWKTSSLLGLLPFLSVSDSSAENSTE